MAAGKATSSASMALSISTTKFRSMLSHLNSLYIAVCSIGMQTLQLRAVAPFKALPVTRRIDRHQSRIIAVNAQQRDAEGDLQKSRR